MANPRLCSIPNCGKRLFSAEWCETHYSRWKKHGDPMLGAKGARPKPVCKVDGCGRTASTHKHGFCNRHELRRKAYGNPLGGGTYRGEPMAYFLDQVLTYEGDECLAWPYAKNSLGYGQLWFNGVVTFVHRLSCEDANGPPPTPKHEACHSCGNGHLACVTKAHLTWKTHSENMKDAAAHGTLNTVAAARLRRRAA